MPILTFQKQHSSNGRIRSGETKVSAKGVPYPASRDTYRITTPSQEIADRCADVLGGKVRPWSGHDGYFDVDTETSELRVSLVSTVDQWFEQWITGGRVRKCDGEKEHITGEPCLCLSSEEWVCKPTSRLEVAIPELASEGVFGYSSNSWEVARNMPKQVSDLLDVSNPAPAVMRLEKVSGMKDGKKVNYVITVIEPALSEGGNPDPTTSDHSARQVVATGDAEPPSESAEVVENPFKGLEQPDPVEPTDDELVLLREIFMTHNPTPAQVDAVDKHRAKNNNRVHAVWLDRQIQKLKGAQES